MLTDPSFYIKKALTQLTTPPALIFLLLAVAYYLMFKKKDMTKPLLAFIMFLVFCSSYQPCIDTAMRYLETRYSPLPTPPHSVRYIVVLGGSHHENATRPLPSQLSAQSVVRLTEAVRLYRQLPNAKVILSGYPGLGSNQRSHASMLKELAVILGIPSHAIITLEHPKDTYEEMQTLAKKLKEKPFILVTSAYHMPRAMQLARKNGLNALPDPVYFLSLPHNHYGAVFDSTALYKATLIEHEFLGMLWNAIVH